MRPRKREVTSPFLTKARTRRREVVEGRRREVERREEGEGGEGRIVWGTLCGKCYGQYIRDM